MRTNMALTYELIATQTTGGSSIAFTSIPNTYTDLILVQQHRNDSQATDTDGFFRFNSDTGATNTYQNVTDGVGDYNNPWSAIMWFADAFSGSQTSTIVFQIFNYASTTMGKTFLQNCGYDSTHQMQLGYWDNNSAITRIDSFSADRWRGQGQPDNFNANCTFSLYGIKEA
jgi:hypothetical protein